MKVASNRIPYIQAGLLEVDKQKIAVVSATTAIEQVKAQYRLFKMVWRLPINKPTRKLTKAYIWPNIREWRKSYDHDIQSLRCFAVTLNNAFKHLKTGHVINIG